MPNFRGKRFTNAHETMIWASKNRNSRYQFNYEAMKNLNDDLQMRSDWFFPLCTGSERLKDDDGRKAHPTQKPEALLYRIIMSSTQPGDLILDPFFGTGTTGAVAKKLGRQVIGIEREQKYIQHARHRLDAITDVPDASLLEAQTKRQAPRIPFGQLLETGLLKPGQVLFDQRQRFVAKIRADATLVSSNHMGDHKGSIHQVGAALQGLPSCNGWTFWHFEAARNQIKPIDWLRQKILSDSV